MQSSRCTGQKVPSNRLHSENPNRHIPTHSSPSHWPGESSTLITPPIPSSVTHWQGSSLQLQPSPSKAFSKMSSNSSRVGARPSSDASIRPRVQLPFDFSLAIASPFVNRFTSPARSASIGLVYKQVHWCDADSPQQTRLCTRIA